ncbi:hypothetical protein GU926_08275 [Nibribacter ruber]|uniref:Uncharacterized protein n=1 Tax=Nibribacter ruber TaxID=2698458 RepID=A0A6P1P1L2_9BACT|nr:hypothetical protein [Nibribacter ruber]QHL87432.1 hypothetical protein GU926_08275 [Nibribacter ruber]
MSTFRFSKVETARSFHNGTENQAKWGIVLLNGLYHVALNRHISILVKAGGIEVSVF